jgi:hypothetical protein
MMALCLLAQEDMQQQTCNHDNQGTYLDAVVAVPAQEETANKQDSTKYYHYGSQILCKAVHCYIVFCLFFSDCKINGFYPKNETLRCFFCFALAIDC